MNSRLQGNLVDAGTRPRGGQPGSAPDWLQVASDQEWPNYWVADYTRSVILEVKGDVRCVLAPVQLRVAATRLGCHVGTLVAPRLHLGEALRTAKDTAPVRCRCMPVASCTMRSP